ncbi:MAG: hypothetical protein R3C52_09205 [Hyphomonadaceae bacterium]
MHALDQMVGDLKPEIGDRPFALADEADLPVKAQLFQGRRVYADKLGRFRLAILAIERKAVLGGDLAAHRFDVEFAARRHARSVPPLIESGRVPVCSLSQAADVTM